VRLRTALAACSAAPAHELRGITWSAQGRPRYPPEAMYLWAGVAFTLLWLGLGGLAILLYRTIQTLEAAEKDASTPWDHGL